MKANTKRKVQIAAVVACLMAAAGASQAQTNTSTNLPVVDVRATDPYALEGTSTAAFTLIRHGPTNTALVVALGLSGTASNGVDYQTVASSVTIPAGFLAVDVPIVPIVVNTGNKTVVLKLDTNSTYNLDRARSAEVKIVDDTFNLPKPTVDILSPTNGSTYTVPAIFTVTADASDSDFAITSVSFYADEFFLGRATNSPYSVTVSNLHAGTYDIFARARDSAGQSGFSTPVSISITNTNGVTRPGRPFGFR